MRTVLCLSLFAYAGFSVVGGSGLPRPMVLGQSASSATHTQQVDVPSGPTQPGVPCNLLKQPSELLYNYFSHLSAQDLKQIRLTCTSVNQLVAPEIMKYREGAIPDLVLPDNRLSNVPDVTDSPIAQGSVRASELYPTFAAAFQAVALGYAVDMAECRERVDTFLSRIPELERERRLTGEEHEGEGAEDAQAEEDLGQPSANQNAQNLHPVPIVNMAPARRVPPANMLGAAFSEFETSTRFLKVPDISYKGVEKFPYFAAIELGDVDLLKRVVEVGEDMLESGDLKLEAAKDHVWSEKFRALIEFDNQEHLIQMAKKFIREWFPQWVVMSFAERGKVDALNRFVQDFGVGRGDSSRSQVHTLAYVILHQFGHRPDPDLYYSGYRYSAGSSMDLSDSPQHAAELQIFRYGCYLWALLAKYHAAAESIMKQIVAAIAIDPSLRNVSRGRLPMPFSFQQRMFNVKDTLGLEVRLFESPWSSAGAFPLSTAL